MESWKILLDTPSENPSLGFSDYASALANIIQSSDAQFAIGIFGGWGSGKTTLMNAIEAQLSEDHVIPVRFSAWRYEREKHLIVPLLDTLRTSLSEWGVKHQKSIAKETAKTIGKVLYSLLAGIDMKLGVPGALEVSLAADRSLAAARGLGNEGEEVQVGESFYHSCFKALSETFRAFVADDPERRIVVFVDDLDRCLPEGALEVLESMKLFFDMEGFVFVVGLDRDVVEEVVETKYSKRYSDLAEGEKHFRVSGSQYIKKLFQVPFNLFPVAVSEIGAFLKTTYVEAGLGQDQIEELEDVVQPHLQYLVTDAGVNPREIKRYINAYTLQRMVRPDLEGSVILCLQTIEFREEWSLVREGVYGYRESFLNHVQQEIVRGSVSLEDLDPRFRAIPYDFLTYVSNGNPGESLLRAAGYIDEYLFAGEVTGSSSSTGFVADLVREITGLRTEVRAIERGEQVPNSLHAKITALVSRFGKDDILNPYTRAALRSVERFSASVPEIDHSGVKRSDWAKRADSLITQAITDLIQGAY